MSDKTEHRVGTASEPGIWSLEIMEEIDYSLADDLEVARKIDAGNYPVPHLKLLIAMDRSHLSATGVARVEYLIARFWAASATPEERDEAAEFIAGS
jgi:hypothetical protein